MRLYMPSAVSAKDNKCKKTFSLKLFVTATRPISHNLNSKNQKGAKVFFTFVLHMIDILTQVTFYSLHNTSYLHSNQ